MYFVENREVGRILRLGGPKKIFSRRGFFPNANFTFDFIFQMEMHINFSRKN